MGKTGAKNVPRCNLVLLLQYFHADLFWHVSLYDLFYSCFFLIVLFNSYRLNKITHIYEFVHNLVNML